jgi:cytochrome b561
MKSPRYHPLLVTLHWLLAFMILFSLAMGTFSLKEIANSSPDKIFALRGHMIAGVLILVLMFVRLAVRFKAPRPAPATTGNGFLDKIAVMTHYGLYVLVFLMAASGIAMSIQAGLPEIVFGSSGAALPETFAVYKPRLVHGLIAKLLLALATLHILAALYHQFVRRDSLLSRMWFGRN